ncbi:MAG: hypothetical protein FWC43_12630 [Planctomycetaceae bacterium]|nr:hypothetical protein [Planctomycetaceae bacterium]
MQTLHLPTKIVLVLLLLCPIALRADDSQWFAIPENASFEQLRDFMRGKPVVVCFYHAWSSPPGVERKTSLSFLLKKLKSYDADYASKDLGIVVYLTGKEHQDFPQDYQQDETMKHWKVISAEDSVLQGLKNYRDYYGFTSSPNWFLIDHDGKVVETKGNFDKVLEALMTE